MGLILSHPNSQPRALLTRYEATPEAIQAAIVTAAQERETERQDSTALLDAARELDRHVLADAVTAFEAAESVAGRELEEFEDTRALPLDHLTDARRLAFLSNMRVGIRLGRMVWRRLLWSRTDRAAVQALKDYASQWVPADQIEGLAHHVAQAVWYAGIAALDGGIPPTPSEFARALSQTRRAGEQS